MQHFSDNTELLEMPEGKDCVMMRLCIDVHYESYTAVPRVND